MKQGTKKIIDSINNYLTEKYGEVKPEWATIMYLLGDNLDLYKECRESIRKNGIYDINTAKKNPLLSTCKDLQATIMKQIQHLGLSPYAASKIKESVEDDTEDFIEALTTNE